MTAINICFIGQGTYSSKRGIHLEHTEEQYLTEKVKNKDF